MGSTDERIIYNHDKSRDSHPVVAAVSIFILVYLVLEKTAQCPGATEVSRATKARFAGIEGVSTCQTFLSCRIQFFGDVFCERAGLKTLWKPGEREFEG